MTKLCTHVHVYMLILIIKIVWSALTPLQHIISWSVFILCKQKISYQVSRVSFHSNSSTVMNFLR